MVQKFKTNLQGEYKMLRKIIPITSIIIISGCGGYDYVEFDSERVMDGGSMDSNNSGNNNYSSNNITGDANSSNVSANNSSAQNIDSGTKSKFDGNMNDLDSGIEPEIDGGKNNIDSGIQVENDSGGNSSGGSSGSNNNCQKNCLDIAFDLTGNTEEKACGVVDDGCGNLIDCGGCPSDSNCGGERIIRVHTDGTRRDREPLNIEHICGSGCYPDFEINQKDPDLCEDNMVATYCALGPAGQEPSNNECTNSTDAYYWCCPW